MSKSLAKKLTCLLAALCAVCLAFGILFSWSGRPVSAGAEGGDENVLYSQDFSNALEGDLANSITASDGEGTVTSNAMFNLPVETMASSNNYSVEFDLKLTGTTEFYVHFVGLDGTHDDNIYLCVIAQGTYLRVTDNYGHDIYNNTGDLHGGLDATPVDLSDFATFKLIHFEGYIELWVNGTRRCVSHLCDFGNNNYMSRSPIEEGTITAIAMHAQNANAAVLDNIKVTEAVGASTSYSEHNPSDSVSSSKIFPLSAVNLYRENFMVEGTFYVADGTQTEYYPSINLYGLNASLLSHNGKEYAVNVQTYANGTTFLPQIMWQPEDPETAWNNRTGSEVTVEQGQTLTLRVEVYGDNFVLYVNGEQSVSTTFTEMGLAEGRVQYIRIQSGGKGVYWTDFRYEGFESDNAAMVTTSSPSTVLAGTDVTFEADLFGTKEGDFSWFVNGEEQSETGMTLTLSDAAAGTYTVQYKSDTVSSEEVTVTVVDKMVTISADKTEIYPTEEVTVTADMQGDFTGETFAWYVNGAAQAETASSITLSGLAAGTYTVQYKSAETESNTITFTVLDSKIEVTTEKSNYLAGETAEFTAELSGMAEDTAIEWYVNGEKQDGASSATFELDLSALEAGDSATVYAMAAGVQSNEVSVRVAFDVKEQIEGDEYYKTIYEDVLEAGGTYGNFSVGEDEDGSLYLYSEVQNASTYYTVNATMPSGVDYMFEYDLYIPGDISTTNFVYPTLAGLNSTYPAGQVEMAWEVNAEGVRPYVKDQSTNREYLHTEYGFGLDLTYEGGIAKKGDWNTITVAVSGSYISMYINDTLALFFEMPTATVASGIGFNLFPDGGAGVVPVRIRNIVISGVSEPAPDLTAVNVSLSGISVEVGGTITATASLTPFNAEANEISWYVNGEKVDGATALTYAYTAETAGEYTIYCVIDGIQSASRTFTVTAAGGGNGGGGSNTGLWIGLGIGLGVVVIAAIVVIVIVVRKKKNA